MKKVEAPTLEEAYQKASLVLECSISELQCEVVQHPSAGIFGFLKKSAIIVATCKNNIKEKTTPKTSVKKREVVPSIEEEVADKIVATVKAETSVAPVPEPLVDTVLEKDSIVDGFFDADNEDEMVEENVVYDELALHIEKELKDLMAQTCFAIDVVEVDVVDNTALIFIDGDDAALLIGKEGYRYNALSYMLFNWLHSKYELFIKLEIAEFLTTQEEMIRNTMKSVVTQVENTGRGKTRFLDGILVQIALEQLRAIFPDKYVAVKTTKEGKKFVVINDFHTKLNA